MLQRLRVPLSDRAFSSLLAAWFVVNLADAVATRIGHSRGSREAVPVYAVLFAHYPVIVGEFVKLVAVTLLALYACRQHHWWRLAGYLELCTVTVDMGYVAAHNMWVLAQLP